ncbi:MAG: ZIP family metal transporter [Bacteroidetes bacterium]|nr:ZIP family metal transporter [Bacteroidota bacterium]
MLFYYNLLLFLLTLVGGCLPLMTAKAKNINSSYLLAFSGSFLLSITFLHLLPESFNNLSGKAGYLLLAGFFVQLLIQRFTHGAEHGHTHLDEHHIPLVSILAGLSLHALLEGLPLGFTYSDRAATPSLYLAIAAHKVPEAMLVSNLVLHLRGKHKAGIVVLIFALITPAASFLTSFLGGTGQQAHNVIALLLPLVAGSFIHIATTIFFESGTKLHAMNGRKIIAILTGVCLGLLSLLFE